MTSMTAEIFTIGHGDQELADLFCTLEKWDVGVLLDVRSYPSSARFPQFNRSSLEGESKRRNIQYRWVEALGGKPRDRSLWINEDTPDYKAIAEQPQFQDALARLIETAKRHRVALMCSEGRPEQCHRALLLGPPLIERGARVRHLLRDGTSLEEVAASRRML
jgi:uncharacterized protein (DUF488 family)